MYTIARIFISKTAHTYGYIVKVYKKNSKETQRMSEKTRDMHAFVSVYAYTNKLTRFIGEGANLHVFYSRYDKR